MLISSSSKGDGMRLKVAEVLSENLILRDTANMLFDMVEKNDEKEVVLDFEGVRSISRSFAHQYVLRRKSSPKTIKEENVPEEVLKMFRIVSERRQPRHELPPANQPIQLEPQA